jgi:hypothetical protein
MAKEEKAEKTAGAKLKVISKRDGFRRAGRAWSGVTEIDAAELDAAQIAQLKDEPMLIVEEI